MNLDTIYRRVLDGEELTFEQALKLYTEAPTSELCSLADAVRVEKMANPKVVTWQIDRNVNITNVCISGCKFCNFHCKPHQIDRHFITSREEY